MPVFDLYEGSNYSGRNIGPVSVAQCNLVGIEKGLSDEHVICVYPKQAVHSVERWEGKIHLRKYWDVGSVGFIPAGSEIRSIPDRPYHETAIKFTNDIFNRAAEGLIALDKLHLQLTDITDTAVFAHAQSISALSIVPDIEQWPLLVECAALALTVSVIKKLSPTGAIAHSDQRHLLCDVRMRRVCEYVEAHMTERISLQQLADAAVLSQYHFSRQFSQKAGMSPLRYVLSRRVEMAKAELEKPGAVLADVAYACGFGGQSHFTTTFKTFVGVTPGEYRRDRCPVEYGSNRRLSA